MEDLRLGESGELMDNDEQHTVLKLKTNESIFDVNSLLLPFIAEYRGEKIRAIEVIQGNSIIRVKSTSDLGVPTLYDKSVLLAIQKLFLQQRSFNGQLILNVKDPSLQDMTMEPVSLREIVRAMGYSKPSTNQLVKVCESIERLNETTYVTTQDRIYDHKNDKYLMTAKKGMHLIDYKLVTLSQEEKEIRKKQGGRRKSNDPERIEKYKQAKEKIFDGYVQITLNHVVYQALACEQLVYYNDPVAVSIKNLTAKHIYLIALKWAGKDKEVNISINKLLMYIPMKEGKELKLQKHAIKQAVNYLNDNGYCNTSYLKNEVVHFNFKKEKVKKIEYESDYLKDKFNTFGELLAGFVATGLEEQYVFSLDMSKLEYYKAVLRYVTLRDMYGSINNKKAFIKDYIENNRKVDEKYFN